MALSSTVLSAALKTKFLAHFPVSTDANGNNGDTYLTEFCNDLAQAIVTHITTTAVVTVVTTCPSGAGSGTGTIS